MNALISKQIANIVGPQSVVTELQVAQYAVDGIVPGAVAFPENRQLLSEVLKWAATEKATVFPRGGGTKLGLGNTPERVDLVLDLRRLDRVLDYQPADMTVTAESGITISALQQELAGGGMFLPLEAPLAAEATVGGTLSVAGSGPLAFTYGPPRDWLIGIGVVGADGTVTKAGGKVVKNVTGYDLNKLYTGSLGTLGIIAEATFKVSPQAPNSGALQASFSSMEVAIEAGRTLLQGPAGPLGYFCATRAVARKLPSGPDSDSCIGLAFYSGRSRATERRMGEGESALNTAGASWVRRLEDPQQASSLLRRVVDLGWSKETLPDLALKISVPPQAVRAIAADLQDVVSISNPPDIACDPGFGTVRTFWWGDGLNGQAYLDAIGAVRRAAAAHGGTAVVEHCPVDIKGNIDVWGEEPGGMEIMRRIKSKFDPSRILNPGRFLGRL